MGRRAIEPTESDRILASLLEKAWVADGQSYERLAEKCDMGRTRLYDVLTGARPLVMSELARISQALGLAPWTRESRPTGPWSGWWGGCAAVPRRRARGEPTWDGQRVVE